MGKSSGHYRFKRHDNVGANDAEDDERFLDDCFEDNGDIDVLMDCENPKRIVLGRTGAGKTALLLQLKKRGSYVVNVNPEQLSLNFLTNSTILPYLSELGVNLDPFFKLLWRHVFAVTIIQNRFDIVDKSKQASFIEQCKEYFDSAEAKAQRQQDIKRREKALQYLHQWGNRFFEDVEYRTKEVAHRFEKAVTKGMESKLGGSLAGKTPLGGGGVQANLDSTAAEADKRSVELKHEIFERAKTVVNEIQVQQLGGILDLLEEVLDDPQKPFYITIDQLDEPWADDDLRLHLLKGLVDTVREFRKVHNAKIIICLRIDLLEQLFRMTRSEAGFQEDKYRSLNLPLRWTNRQLEKLLDSRVEKLVRDAYTNYSPTLSDIVPDVLKFGRKRQIKTVDYILQRTWGRPRDAIEFLNACIVKSEGKVTISKDAILDAEGEYSRGRLRAIAAEWHAQYPHLADTTKALLTNRRSHFKLNELSDEQLEQWSLALSVSDSDKDGELHILATRTQMGEIDKGELRREVASVLYKTGCVGLKTYAFMQTRWANSESYSVSPAEIDDSSSVQIHWGLWRVLGVQDS